MRRLVAAGIAALTMAMPAQAAARVAIYGPGEAYPAKAGYKPTKWYPDNRTLAWDFHWSVWSSSEAIGTGMTKTCAPGNLDCTTVRQTITYTKPRSMCGVMTFTHFHYGNWPATGVLDQVGTNPPLCLWYDS